MAKTKEELESLRQEIESLNSKLKELSEDELKLVCGGGNFDLDFKIGAQYEFGWNLSMDAQLNTGKIE